MAGVTLPSVSMFHVPDDESEKPCHVASLGRFQGDTVHAALGTVCAPWQWSLDVFGVEGPCHQLR